MTDSPTRKRKTKKKLNWKKVATSLVVVILIVCLGMGCFFAWSVYKETDDFSAKKLLSGEASKMYDINGELMYTFGSDTNGKRENVTYEDLPQVLIDAVVAAEDSRFFEHNGFDLPRIAKTMITNLAHLSIRGGGSTITQQVIKKSYFPKEEQTYTRKLSEIILAIQATKEISKEEALEMFKDDEYKIDLINNFENDTTISCYRQGDFVDLCRGPHVETVKACKNFKLTKHSGAYWKGDKENKVLQRIYGVCFETSEDLAKHLELLEEAKRRDHKKLGKELGLFMMSEYAPGMPFFLPKGMILRNTLEQFWYEEHAKEGYEFIKTPIMMSRELWETSGHWENYKEDMYTSMVDDREFAIKPMNCPGSLLVYKKFLTFIQRFTIKNG